MKNNLFMCLYCLLVLIFTTSCLVRSSLVYLDSDTEGVPNLLSNPDFQAYSLDPDEALLGWTVHTQSSPMQGTPVYIDVKEAKHGNTSLRIDASEHQIVLLSDAFKVRRYGGFYSRIFVKSALAKGPQITMNFITFKDNGAVYSRFHSKLNSTSAWKKCAISAGFLKPGVSFGRIQIIIPPFTSGSIWLDDAGCWEVHHFRID
jgi:hypothetical protein